MFPPRLGVEPLILYCLSCLHSCMAAVPAGEEAFGMSVLWGRWHMFMGLWGSRLSLPPEVPSFWWHLVWTPGPSVGGQGGRLCSTLPSRADSPAEGAAWQGASDVQIKQEKEKSKQNPERFLRACAAAAGRDGCHCDSLLCFSCGLSALSVLLWTRRVFLKLGRECDGRRACSPSAKRPFYYLLCRLEKLSPPKGVTVTPHSPNQSFVFRIKVSSSVFVLLCAAIYLLNRMSTMVRYGWSAVLIVHVFNKTFA